MTMLSCTVPPPLRRDAAKRKETTSQRNRRDFRSRCRHLRRQPRTGQRGHCKLTTPVPVVLLWALEQSLLKGVLLTTTRAAVAAVAAGVFGATPTQTLVISLSVVAATAASASMMMVARVKARVRGRRARGTLLLTLAVAAAAAVATAAAAAAAESTAKGNTSNAFAAATASTPASEQDLSRVWSSRLLIREVMANAISMLILALSPPPPPPGPAEPTASDALSFAIASVQTAGSTVSDGAGGLRSSSFSSSSCSLASGRGSDCCGCF
mmetsp:Transcript_54045/g.108721  ORF Transcript_54045/g.108721 Transcript_54045/m.108721 type:complete len:268 (-) Transcript_54045:1006-1809(-)